MVEIVLEKPQPGDWLRQAYWYNADNPEEKNDAEDKVTTAILELAMGFGVTTKPIQWEHISPDSPQVPAPPDRLHGNIKCAIGSAEVICPVYTGPKFTEEIEPHELAELREATRRAHWKVAGTYLSTEDCDDRINDRGPIVAGRRPN